LLSIDLVSNGVDVCVDRSQAWARVDAELSIEDASRVTLVDFYYPDAGEYPGEATAALANTCFDFNQGAELSGLAEAILDARCSGGCEPEQDPASRWATSGGCAASEEVALRDGNSVQIICEGNSSDEALETAIASGIASARICADGQLWQNSGEQQGDLRVLFTLQSDDGDEVVCCHNVEF
jgi:hypothetical protein